MLTNLSTRGGTPTHYKVWCEGTRMATGLQKVLEQIQQGGNGLTDGQLLTRFVAARDEASFAALVRRHGPMVLGVCSRLLRDFHDAEDAFQATFLILARKAGSVVKRESVGCWLYGVAYRTAQEARSASARRRERERPMSEVPHPVVPPAESQDWRPLLDQELNRLPEKYRSAVVLCDLEGRSRREAARQLDIPEGTLSSRLATARQLLAKRLAGSGLALSGGALAVAMSEGAASAQVPAALVWSTARAAVLVASGQVTAVAPSAAALMEGVIKAMFLKKLRVVVGGLLVMAGLAAVGVAYQGEGRTAQAAPPEKREEGKLSELEALRKENELLKVNLNVVLEKVRSQETEIKGLRERPAVSNPFTSTAVELLQDRNFNTFTTGFLDRGTVLRPDPVQEAESALKALREAKDKEAKRRATESLEKALQKIKEQGKDTRPAGGN
jgi:RNA polymerase sigma factor (sigma-70 family)